MENRRERLLNTPDLIVDKLPDGQIEIGKKTGLDAQGNPTYHRYVILPGRVEIDEDPRIKVIVESVHTPTLVSIWWVEERKRQADAER